MMLESNMDFLLKFEFELIRLHVMICWLIMDI